MNWSLVDFIRHVVDSGEWKRGYVVTPQNLNQCLTEKCSFSRTSCKRDARPSAPADEWLMWRGLINWKMFSAQLELGISKAKGAKLNAGCALWRALSILWAFDYPTLIFFLYFLWRLYKCCGSPQLAATSIGWRNQCSLHAHIYLHIDWAWSALPLANELLAIYEEPEKKCYKFRGNFWKLNLFSLAARTAF